MNALTEWEIGDRYGVAGVKSDIFGDGRCSYCNREGGELIWEGRRDINGKVMDAHVHRFPEPQWGDGTEGSDYEIFTYDTPGYPRLVAVVYSREDADRIIASVSEENAHS